MLATLQFLPSQTNLHKIWTWICQKFSITRIVRCHKLNSGCACNVYLVTVTGNVICSHETANTIFPGFNSKPLYFQQSQIYIKQNMKHDQSPYLKQDTYMGGMWQICMHFSIENSMKLQSRLVLHFPCMSELDSKGNSKKCTFSVKRPPN